MESEAGCSELIKVENKNGGYICPNVGICNLDVCI